MVQQQQQRIKYDEYGLIRKFPEPSNAEKKLWLSENDPEFPEKKCCFSCCICGPIYALSYSGWNWCTGWAFGFGYGLSLIWTFLGWLIGWLGWTWIAGEEVYYYTVFNMVE